MNGTTFAAIKSDSSSRSQSTYQVGISLRSKRFRGVWEQRKTEELDFRCFSPSPSPSFLFLALAPFPRGQNTENSVSLTFFAPIPTETLTTQAKSGCDSDSSIGKRRSKHALNSIHNHRNYKIIDSNAMDWANGHKNTTSETISRPGIAIESLVDIKTAAQDNCPL